MAPSVRFASYHTAWPFEPDSPPATSSRHREQYVPHIADDIDPSAMFLSPLLEDDHEDDHDEADVFFDAYQELMRPPLPLKQRSANRDLFRARLEEKWESIAAKRLLSSSPKYGGDIGSGTPSRYSFPSTYSRSVSFPDSDSLPDLDEDVSVASDDSDAPDSPKSDDENSVFFRGPDHHTTTTLQSSLSPNVVELDGWEADQERGRGRDRSQPAPTCKPRPGTTSGRRRSWRSPGYTLWTVAEEPEPESSIPRHAARSTFVGDKMTRRKSAGSKKVHWNEEVQVVEFCT